MSCQGFPPFLVTKYTYLLHFQRHCGHSILYDKDSIDSMFDYPETSMAPTILITEIHPTNTISPNIALSEFPLMESTPTTQEKTTTPNNGDEFFWDTLS